MAEKEIDIKGRFAHELSEIAYILKNLENGRVYDINGVQGDGSLGHNVTKLRKGLNNLLHLIEYGKESAMRK